MLPETDTAGAAVFANRVIDMMKKPALAGASENMQLVFSFGIASCPDDARDLETLVAAVRVAKNKSRMMGAPVILYGDN
jgi:GGDEF domain-containing protein